MAYKTAKCSNVGRRRSDELQPETNNHALFSGLCGQRSTVVLPQQVSEMRGMVPENIRVQLVMLQWGDKDDNIAVVVLRKS